MKFKETLHKIFTKHIPLKLLAIALAVLIAVIMNAV